MARKTPNNAKLKTIQAADIDIALHMLTTYLNAKDISPLLSSLEALKADPRNESRQEQVSEAFHGLGPFQGAVLTYAPYLHIFVSDDPFDD